MTARRSLLLVTLLALVAFLGFSSAAGAVENPDYGSPVPPSVTVPERPTSVERAPASPAGRSAAAPITSGSSAGTASAAAGRQSLAITGGDTAGLAAIGALLLAAGGALLLYRRRAAA